MYVCGGALHIVSFYGGSDNWEGPGTFPGILRLSLDYP